MMIKLTNILLLSFSIFLFESCIREKLETNLSDYAEKNKCKTKSCILKMSEITWFKWDTMSFKDDESGLHLIFKFKSNTVYTYTKKTNFDGPNTIEYLDLESSYSINNANFRLEVGDKSDFYNSKVYMLLPFYEKKITTKK